MPWRRDLTVGTAGATTPDFYTAWTHPVRDWINAKNQATVQLEDRQFGTLPGTGADWGPRLNAIINEIEQTDPLVGATIQCYPEQKKISTTVDAFTGKKYIAFESASKGSNSLFASRGYGASFYTGTSGMTMFRHGPPPSTNGLNHWGPFFDGITFASGDFPTNTTLLLIEAANYWGLRDCAFAYGNVQLKIDSRLDINSGYDASYGHLNRVVFNHYNSRGLHMVNGMVKATDLSWHQGVTGSWGMQLDGDVANAAFFGLKWDTLANGLLCRGYANSFFHCAMEGALVALRLEKDPAVSYSCQANRFFDLHTTFRGAAGEIGVQVDTDVTGYNTVVEHLPWGSPGAGGAVIQDPNGNLRILTDSYIDGNGPMIRELERFAAPPTPPAGVGLLYYRSGAWRVMHSDGVERSITTS
jgi:hypothetical protein